MVEVLKNGGEKDHCIKWIKYSLQYKQLHPKTKLYCFNLNNYSQSAFDVKGNDVYTISGFSEKVFDIMRNIERGGEALDEIKNIQL